MTDISNIDDIIDSRDIIERIEQLEAMAEEAISGEGPALDEEEAEELRILGELAQEAEGYAADWLHGEALIRRSYFKEYAQQLAEDCGFEGSNDWPGRCIDWEQAARELEQDYTSVDFGGVEYLIR